MAAGLEAALDRILAAEAPADADTLLELFVEDVEARGLTLYEAQEEAVLELLAGNHVVLSTPTGSGKSLVARALHLDALAKGERSVYTSPIKALVNEKFFELCTVFGPARVGLMTGDASVNPGAEVICCTQEVLALLAVRGEARFAQAVIDEFHYYADPERGMAWHLPLITLPETRFLLMSATLGDLSPTLEALEAFSGRPVVQVHRDVRPVPLSWRYADAPLHETIEGLLGAGEAPIYLVSFTQRAALDEAQALTSLKLIDKEKKREIAEALAGEKFDTPFGKTFARLLKAGVGLHHGGLIPRYRRLTERLAQAGLLRVISGTDTLGVGVNIPLRTVLLTGLCKYDGTKMRLLTSRELHQIAGRAGRKGFDDHGNVVVQAPAHVIENKRVDEKIARRPDLARKLSKSAAPKGFVPWDEPATVKIKNRPPEPLVPVFELDFGLLLSVLQVGSEDRDGGYRRLLAIIEHAHLTEGQKAFQRRRLASRLRALRKAEVVRLERRQPGGHARLQLDDTLDESFSLDDALGLYLLAAVESLLTTGEGEHDPGSIDAALTALSVIEAILEDPRAILARQLSTLKGELVAKLKSEGVPYDERMELLDELEPPRPDLEFLEATFEAFARHRPWVRERGLAPKTIAREMIERAHSFETYVTHHGLERMEGVLLRHLNDVYRVLRRGLPEALITEPLADISATLEGIIRGVDSSLLDEWEAMQGVLEVAPGERLALIEALSREGAAAVVHEVRASSLAETLAADEKQLTARVRAEVHQLLGLLARGQLEAAAARLPEGAEPWTPERLQAELDAFAEVNGELDVSPRGRAPWFTHLNPDGDRQWKVQQILCGLAVQDDAAETSETDWALLGRVDLRTPAEGRPLLELLAFER
ncbi:MAG: DUF3516 domain-containing protein [Deltaproteobacteria bacterium]|nr:DUF3516 domain-containing protein [Deltaproteobacteria bacterium]